MALQRTGDCAG